MRMEAHDLQDKCSSVTIAGRPESVSRSRPIESVARSVAAAERVIPKESACGGIGVVERVVKREVAGRQWEEAKWLDLCEFSEEVGGKVMEELVQDLLFELSCR
ncbi:uncharacterized protein LOC122037123 [Zingiber officinale]|uniref:uncharacterized protein LOC122037123 n=1 Tax=Zingiber officinale TaxID=94328 RepID=UPI001C4B26CC|nr:uncharacterized protein LOC122037123 [Zingiber officinale]